MKKKGIFIGILIFCTLLIVSIKKILLKEYSITYHISNYSIKEIYKKDNNHSYDLIISNNNNTYIYRINHNYHKKKKIITDIKTFKSNNITCIIPSYRKNMNSNIYCNLGNEQVSPDYLIKEENKDFIKIQKKIKDYQIPILNVSNEKSKKYKNIKVYQKNISQDSIYYIWDYKGIYVLTDENILYKKILKKDLYENILSTTVGRNFILFDNTSVSGIEKVYIYNEEKGKVKKVVLNKKISKDSYINGVINNTIYITDKREKKEYTLDIGKGKIEEIDEDGTVYIIYDNNEKKELSKSDYFMTEQYFSNMMIDNKDISESPIKKDNDYYYYFEEDNLYQIYKEEPKHKILLLSLDNVKDWNIYDDKIILIKEDTIYCYTSETGLKEIIKSNELKYNYKNIYKVGKK